jgi:putative ABC transport system ATP-binding protein
MIELRGVSKRFHAGTADERVALGGIDLTIAPGDFVVVIGSNGSGKSTLLNAIAGAVAVDTGAILIDGAEVTREPVHQRARRIARVFQDPLTGTFAGMSVEENLLLAELRGARARLRTGLTPEGRARWRDALASLQLGLEMRLASRVAQLSGGQRQALALVMATLSAPRLLLLDEHTAALDPRTAETVMRATVETVTRHGLATLMVTHNMQHAIAFGDRLIMMREGRIALDLAGEEKRRLTAADLVARFDVLNDRILLRA